MEAQLTGATHHTSSDVWDFLWATWRRAAMPDRTHEIVLIAELDVPTLQLWRVDCLDRLHDGQIIDYCVIIYEDAAGELQRAFRKKVES